MVVGYMKNFVSSRKYDINSSELIKVATCYFEKHIKPEMEKNFPEIFDYAGVQITSSVAYGFADKYSDLDMFLIFEEHDKYLFYNESIEDLIKGIKVPENLNSVCDKGMRLEIESLRKSGLEELVKNTHDVNLWLKQEEWLLYWFTNAITLSDKTCWITKLKSQLKFFPEEILNIKYCNACDDLMVRYSKLKEYENKNDFWSKVSYQKSLLHCTYLLMKLFYWNNTSYIPHAKWIYKGLAVISREGEKLAQDLLDTLTNKLGISCLEPWINKFINKKKRKSIKSNLLEGSAIFDKKSNTLWVIIPPNAQVNSFYKESWRSNWEYDNNTRIVLSIDHGLYLGKDEKVLGQSYSSWMEIDVELAEAIIYRQQSMQVMRGKIPKLSYPHSMVTEKKLLYLLFIIWRKIRVVNGAFKRENIFNMNWYSLQVIEHILEFLFILHDNQLPVLELRETELNKYSDIPGEIKRIFKEGLILWNTESKSQFEKNIGLFWDVYYVLGKELVKRNIVNEDLVKFPLPMQFNLEYWKYENRNL